MGINLEDLNFSKDSKICLMVALVVVAYVLNILQGLENKVEKRKSIKVNPPGWQFHISDKGFQSSKLRFGL